MPLIQIHLMEGKSPEYVQAVLDGIHAALMTSWKIPHNDRFQTVQEYKKGHFYIDKTIWDVKRSDDVIVIYITSIKRTKEMKLALYQELTKVLGKKPGVRPEDVFVSIVDIERENWSFGNGIAQLSS